MTRLHSLPDAAAACGTTLRHMRRLIGRADDPLPSIKLGGKRRVSEEDLRAWLARQPHDGGAS